MTAKEIFLYLHREIHTTVAATVDKNNLPVTCAIDIMDADENGMYFLTARGKGFYDRLVTRGYLALTGMKGEDTMSCVAVSVRGKVKELGSGLIFLKSRSKGFLLPSDRRKQSRRDTSLLTPVSVAMHAKEFARSTVLMSLPYRQRYSRSTACTAETVRRSVRRKRLSGEDKTIDQLPVSFGSVTISAEQRRIPAIKSSVAFMR